MDGYEKTPTLGLNKPEKGDFDWDLPLNENWDILDKVGGAQLPLLATIDLDYKLSGDAAIGWALAGSTLSGNTYTSLWNAMKVAYDRSTAANETHYDKTYSVRTDAVTGWRFVTDDVFNSALSAFGDSLGHVLNTEAKTIILRASQFTYDLPTQDTTSIGIIGDETLPTSRGASYVSNVTQDFNGQQADGIFTLNGSTFNTSNMSRSPYYDNAQVRPQSKNLLRYYKVGNTITNVENIDVGTILDSISDMVHANEFVETKRIVTETWRSGTNWYTKYSDGWIEQGGDTVLINASLYTVTLHVPYQQTTYFADWVVNGTTTDSYYSHTIEKTTRNFVMRDYLMKNMLSTWYACGY